MLDQREKIGLAASGGRRLMPGFLIVPVIAVGLPYNERSKIPPRIDAVRGILDAACDDLVGLEVWTIRVEVLITRLEGPSLVNG